MVDEKVSLEKGVSDLFVVLTSEVIPSYLERDYKEIYDLEDDVTSFECMADDVARVWRLVEWHDKLAEVDDATWKFIESDDPNDLELRFKTTDWLVRLKERIDSELMMRKLREKSDDDDE